MMRNAFILSLILLACASCGESNKTTIESEENKPVGGSAVSQEFHPDGPFESRYTNGQIKLSGDYLGGKKQGLWTGYYESGIKQSESSYNGGELHGKSSVFYNNGQVRYIGYYKNGLRDGQWIFFDENGTEQPSKVYSKGDELN